MLLILWNHKTEKGYPFNPLLSFTKIILKKIVIFVVSGLSLVPLTASTFILSDYASDLDARFECWDVQCLQLPQYIQVSLL